MVSTWQRGKGCAGIERLLRETEQDGRVLADGVQHHRPLELGYHFPDDVDTFGFERAQVIEPELWVHARARQEADPEPMPEASR